MRMRLVNMKKTVNQLPAKDGKDPGNQALPEFSRNTQPATYQRGCSHKPYLQYPAEGPLIAPFKFSRQNNLVSVLRNIAIGDVYERAVDKHQKSFNIGDIDEPFAFVLIPLPLLLSCEYIMYNDNFKHEDILLLWAYSTQPLSGPIEIIGQSGHKGLWHE